MPNVRFSGVAPIRKGTVVRMLVNDANNPTSADVIEDFDTGITYSIEEPSKAEARFAAGPGAYVRATVESAFIHSSGVTDLTVSNVRRG